MFSLRKYKQRNEESKKEKKKEENNKKNQNNTHLRKCNFVINPFLMNPNKNMST